MRGLPLARHLGQLLPLFADDIVGIAQRVDGIALDYAVASLSDVDAALASFATEGIAVESIAETLFAFGAYVGEVFVRHNSARWRDISRSPLAASLGPVPMVIEFPDQRLANPIGKCFKRITGGDVESITYFYRVFSTSGPSSQS